MSLTTLYGEMQETYLALIRTFPLHPLRSEGELDEAMEVVDALVGKEMLTAAEADYLAVLSDLVEQYEAGAHPMPPASDAELLQHLLEAQAVTRYTQASILRPSRPAGKPAWLCLHTHCGFSVRCTPEGVSP
jgi:HTH-type transcriptional regulator/antitoxin HigA